MDPIAQAQAREAFATRVASRTEAAANAIAVYAQGALEDRALEPVPGISTADTFMKGLAIAVGGIIDKAKAALTQMAWVDDIGFHARAKKMAKCIGFVMQHGHPTYLKLMRDQLRVQYNRGIFNSGHGVKEGSRLYPVGIINSADRYVVSDRDAFKCFCLWTMYKQLGLYADPNDDRKFFLTSKGFSELFLGLDTDHLAGVEELPVDLLSPQDAARMPGIAAGTTQLAAAGVGAGGGGQLQAQAGNSPNTSISAGML